MLREEELKPVTKILERQKLFFSSKCVFQDGFSSCSIIFHLLYKKPNGFQMSSPFSISRQGLGKILPDKLIKNTKNGSFIIDTSSNWPEKWVKAL